MRFAIGFAVTKKNYDGKLSKIEPFFRALLNKYVRYIFEEDLRPKVINNREITGPELYTFFEVYVKMFQVGQKTFPKAMTMLEATAEANNRNAYDQAMAFYKANMDSLCGTEKSYVKEKEVEEKSAEFIKKAMDIFDEIATMGAVSTIQKIR